MITQGACQVYCKSANITVEMPVSRVYPLSHFSTPDHGNSCYELNKLKSFSIFRCFKQRYEVGS